MDRRRFLLTSLAGALAAPLAAESQPAAKVYRVGYLGNFPVTASTNPPFAAFAAGLCEYGYVEDVNRKLEYCWAAGRNDVWMALVRELVQAGVQVVVTPFTPAALPRPPLTSELEQAVETMRVHLEDIALSPEDLAKLRAAVQGTQREPQQPMPACPFAGLKRALARARDQRLTGALTDEAPRKASKVFDGPDPCAPSSTLAPRLVIRRNSSDRLP